MSEQVVNKLDMWREKMEQSQDTDFKTLLVSLKQEQCIHEMAMERNTSKQKKHKCKSTLLTPVLISTENQFGT